MCTELLVQLVSVEYNYPYERPRPRPAVHGGVVALTVISVIAELVRPAVLHQRRVAPRPVIDLRVDAHAVILYRDGEADVELEVILMCPKLPSTAVIRVGMPWSCAACWHLGSQTGDNFAFKTSQ
jgi:hypothetical protein